MIRVLKADFNKESLKIVCFYKVLSTMTLSTKPPKKLEKLKNKEMINHILCDKDELDLGITLKGGQSFR